MKLLKKHTLAVPFRNLFIEYTNILSGTVERNTRGNDKTDISEIFARKSGENGN
jgi:hypothetical protein